MKKLFFVEMTDTFGGEANYGWVNRFMVTAASSLGAIRKVTKKTGYHAKKYYDEGDAVRYNVPGACICYFVSYSDGSESEHYNGVETL